jgi:hypothetical protein
MDNIVTIDRKKFIKQLFLFMKGIDRPYGHVYSHHEVVERVLAGAGITDYNQLEIVAQEILIKVNNALDKCTVSEEEG